MALRPPWRVGAVTTIQARTTGRSSPHLSEEGSVERGEHLIVTSPVRLLAGHGPA